jgi:hypothetical protein
VKKPFYARVVAFSNVTARRGYPSPVFTINERVTDAPDAHMNRVILTRISDPGQARSLANSLLAWADSVEKLEGKK